MGASRSKLSRPMEKPEDVSEFRQLTGPACSYIIPEVPEKRKVTDSKFAIAFGVCLILLLPFMIYAFTQSNLNRLIHGYDNCGNVCGDNNSRIDNIECSGKDNTKQPFLLYEIERDKFDKIHETSKCVETCDHSEHYIIMNRCIEKADKDSRDIFADIASGLNNSAGTIVALCFIGFGLSVVMLLLFRYFVAVVVWVILIGSIVGIIALTGTFWVLYKNATGDKSGLLYLSILFSILSIVLVIVLICMFKRIKLVIRLFKEAIKIIFAVPLILFEPLLTLVASTILLIIWAFFIMVWITAGSLQHINRDLYSFVPNGVVIFTIIFHCIICIWMAQFIVGCQHMVISGTVSAVYFARTKSAVVSPIYYSFYNLLRYHLGTVAFGSLILSIVAIIKGLVRSMVDSKCGQVLIECCLGSIEELLQYISKNAYIQTAMHGQPFFKSGKRAVRLLYANALTTIAINSVGDFVLTMAKIFIILVTVGIGMLIYDHSIPYYGVGIFISAIVTAVIADCFFSVFETAVDTIFLCFCEDHCMNDGMDRPYYMSTNLMQYMEDAKKTVKDKNNPN